MKIPTVSIIQLFPEVRKKIHFQPTCNSHVAAVRMSLRYWMIEFCISHNCMKGSEMLLTSSQCTGMYGRVAFRFVCFFVCFSTDLSAAGRLCYEVEPGTIQPTCTLHLAHTTWRTALGIKVLLSHSMVVVFLSSFSKFRDNTNMTQKFVSYCKFSVQ